MDDKLFVLVLKVFVDTAIFTISFLHWDVLSVEIGIPVRLNEFCSAITHCENDSDNAPSVIQVRFRQTFLQDNKKSTHF